MDRDFTVFFVIAGVIAILLSALFIGSYVECKEKGGAYVEAAIWYECIPAK